ncbi:hypothetical protein FQA39_LY10114 [Lamprigera yunnana]|nr:hypothetical protein FQA39_LY10114 [Lamprigera yunnana]
MKVRGFELYSPAASFERENNTVSKDNTKSNTGSESTKGEKLKREAEQVNSDDEIKSFAKPKKTIRSPANPKQKREDKLDRVLDMLQQLMIDVNQIKTEQINFNKEMEGLKKEMEENTTIKSNYKS